MKPHQKPHLTLLHLNLFISIATTTMKAKISPSKNHYFKFIKYESIKMKIFGFLTVFGAVHGQGYGNGGDDNKVKFEISYR